jgi:hypothetical protein
LGIASLVSFTALYEGQAWVFANHGMTFATICGLYMVIIIGLLPFYNFFLTEIYFRNQENIGLRVKLSDLYEGLVARKRWAMHFNTVYLVRRIIFLAAIIILNKVALM